MLLTLHLLLLLLTLHLLLLLLWWWQGWLAGALPSRA
jgi:hypothetical protein